MTEQDAKAWIAARHGETAVDHISAFLAMVADENGRQNLISPSTIETIWSRHALDSVQLLSFLPGGAEHWIDIGTGGGFPGMVVALAWEGRVSLVEPRKRRAAFLAECVEQLGISDRVMVHASKIEAVRDQADVISARAVATVENLLRAAAHCGKQGTRWLLPRGRFNERDLDGLRHHWQFVFHVEHSVTSTDSSIVILDRVRAK
ncbi:16S rRNA (guanine(527)-N(7))-methyltransferase RsmG [uncultured Sphingomonas sp.]|uniref:16S rRNA (guanine(527)-N(7))-methyltransferase RsmG n=1 Tax=Sphingomonas sp. TaxID=28214 RepID=UPI00262BDECF|nr:16S rRNA (guanine(527)-N(7))-methyltransferase RsmG [uncultured Sphingomonas sp.]